MKSSKSTLLLPSCTLALGTFLTVSTAHGSTDYTPAIWNPPSGCTKYYTSGYGHKFHVIHDMEGYYLSSVSLLRSCSSTVSVFYAVNGKQDTSTDASAGQITQMVRDADYAWHVCCWNKYCTGTEHEGFASNPAWYTQTMYYSSAGISAHEAIKYGFAKDRNHIVGHNEHNNAAWRSYASANFGINPTCNSHTDPGSYWDWSLYMNLVKSGAMRTPCNYDGGGKTDFCVYRPSTGTFWVSGSGGFQYGTNNDIAVPGDYDGDGVTDYAVWRPSNGIWYVSGVGQTTYGTNGDIPVPGDYNGDGKTDYALFRPSNGTWYVKGMASVQYGTNGDIPVPGDYDGDGKTDFAVWRPSNQTFYVNGVGNTQYGISGDIPVPGDYNGDGKTDYAVFRPSNGNWYVQNVGSFHYGQAGDIPAPGDYNGDGKTDYAVWRPSNFTWYSSVSGDVVYGTTGDIPLPLPYSIRKFFFP